MAIVIVGKPFHKVGKTNLYVTAKCDCGKVWDIRWYRRDKTKSCGCLPPNFKHGHNLKNCERTRVYRTWLAMKERCTKPSHRDWHRYGGRGIEVCERWMEFKLFLEDMGNRPDGHTIDRIDNDKGYEPGNCRWATITQQSRNRSSNLMITLYGKTMCLADWHKIVEHEVDYNTIHCRLVRGWTAIQAIFGRPNRI